jgi:DNA-binding CsgD family transcriptional regulator
MSAAAPDTLAVSQGREAAEPLGSESLCRLLFERSGLSMASLGPDIRIREANGEFARHFDRPSGNVLGRSFYDLLHPATRPVLRRHFDRLTDGRRNSFTERIVAVRPSATVFSGELTGVAVRLGAQGLDSITLLLRPENAAAGQETQIERRKLLTELDARILEGIATGKSSVQLATKLYLSRQGVEYHVSTMLRKFKVPNRAALISRAYSSGILAIGSWPPHVLPEAIQ